jgi:hypothetical protein
MMTESIPPGYFKQNYSLKGSDWIRYIPAEERQALAHYAFACSDYGRKGGRVRADTAQRYPKGHPKAGRFMPKSSNQSLIGISAYA